MIIHVQFVVVAGRVPHGSDARKYFESYNYNHDVISLDERGGYFVGVLRVESPTADRTAFLAKYQSDRYRSGLLASKVLDAKPTANDLSEFFYECCPQAFA